MHNWSTARRTTYQSNSIQRRVGNDPATHNSQPQPSTASNHLTPHQTKTQTKQKTKNSRRIHSPPLGPPPPNPLPNALQPPSKRLRLHQPGVMVPQRGLGGRVQRQRRSQRVLVAPRLTSFRLRLGRVVGWGAVPPREEAWGGREEGGVGDEGFPGGLLVHWGLEDGG